MPDPALLFIPTSFPAPMRVPPCAASPFPFPFPLPLLLPFPSGSEDDAKDVFESICDASEECDKEWECEC
jgi:hypothetical protein